MKEAKCEIEGDRNKFSIGLRTNNKTKIITTFLPKTNTLLVYVHDKRTTFSNVELIVDCIHIESVIVIKN